MNCTRRSARRRQHSRHSLSIKTIKKNWIFLLDQISPSALSTRDLGKRLILTQFPGGCAWIYNSVSKTVLISYPDLLSTASVLQWHGHPRVLGFSIPKTLVIGASPSHITLAIWVRVTGDAHITRCLGMGMPKTRGCPYHCDIGFVNNRSGYEIKTVLQCN